MSIYQIANLCDPGMIVTKLTMVVNPLENTIYCFDYSTVLPVIRSVYDWHRLILRLSQKIQGGVKFLKAINENLAVVTLVY